MARDVVLTVVGILVGSALSLGIGVYFYLRALHDTAAQEDINRARHVVAAMATLHPIRNSQDFEERVAAYLDALRRGRADGRGVPVYREDGSIGVLFSIEIAEYLKLGEGRLGENRLP
jgi:hypothetical protein